MNTLHGVFGDGDLLFGVSFVVNILVKFSQVQAQQDRIKLAFRRRALRQVGQREVILPDRVLRPVLQPRQASA